MPEPIAMTLITERAGGPEAGVTGTGGASVEITTRPWWQMVAIRVARTYLQGLLGFLVAGGIGLDAAVGVPIDQLGNALVVSASLAAAPAAVSLIQNMIELLTKLDVTMPGLRA